MTKALVAYATRTGETQQIGELVAEGMRFSGIAVDVVDVKNIASEKDLAGYDAYVFGSPTYHGDMLQGMKTFLFLVEKVELKGRAGGAFGSFGWSGEAAERIFETMKNIFGMDMADNPLMLKNSSLGGGIKMAQDYGRQIAAKLGP
ncbi:MAG: flavodoxin domain-containing protein [Desulfobacteraceae bacterium]|nr:flavodoxin domain-containing protein [Desulfobacteraceae bacterium]